MAFLAACSNTTTPAGNPNGYVATVDIGAGDTQASIAQQYGGEVIAWLDDKAILKLSNQAYSALKSKGVSIQATTNQTFATPEAATSATAAGWNAWAGGWNAWAGGWNAWAGGIGSITSLTTENTPIWDKIRLTQAQAFAPKLGQGVKVAVIDSGIDLTHPAFANRLAPTSEWKDFIDGDAYPMEVGQAGDAGYGHGSSVAGIVAQVAPKAIILPIRVLNQYGQGDLANVIAAIDWAVQKGAKVINLSLGTNFTASPLISIFSLQMAIMNATMKGIYVVTSAGNQGQLSLTIPANNSQNYSANVSGLRPGQLTGVGSVSTLDQRSVFSNYGADLELVAPGEKVYGPAPGNKLTYWSGTSMAAPMVSGAYALALGEPTRVKVAISSSFETWLLSNADTLTSTNLGKRLNIERFLRAVLN